MTESSTMHNNNNGHHARTTATASLNTTATGNMSTLALETKLKQLRDLSNSVSTKLTQKLSSSRSGQDLLHIGTSLSTLPPDLHSLVSEMHPMVVSAEETEQSLEKHLAKLEKQQARVRLETVRITQAQECADLYQDLVAAERQVEHELDQQQVESMEYDNDNNMLDDLDLVLGLERAALVSLHLNQELESSTIQVSNMTSPNPKQQPQETTNTTEQAQFIMKLAQRIRSLERRVASCLSNRFEAILLQQQASTRKESLLMMGHCMRGLAVLGRGKEVESVFARVAIMPCIRSKVSMGNLDLGGGRGECAGLSGLLEDLVSSVASAFGPILELSESTMLPEIDLVTRGVWVPIATTLMADPGIKMAIFSPGIASVLQANYSTLDSFLSKLARRLLPLGEPIESQEEAKATLEDLYYQPTITSESIQQAQDRIYRHSITSDFSKKWNLPIYYQLRFGETCTRLNTAMDKVQLQSWTEPVFTGSDDEADLLRNSMGLELPVFWELYDVLDFLWKPNVLIRPLSHRFLRGAVQLVGRMVSFCQDGLDKKIQFGRQAQEQTEQAEEGVKNEIMNGDSSETVREPYYWAENPRDVAVVAWDLTVLQTSLTHDYVHVVCSALCEGSTDHAQSEEIRPLVSQVLLEASEPIGPLVQKCWNGVIVDIITTKCCAPLAAVKVVGTTYRLTNRPPPTTASSFVSMILRPLQEFVEEFDSRTPPQVGGGWKTTIVSTVTNRYSVAVEELLVTFQRSEVALKNRRARRGVSSGGMSDGEKVKLQLYLDYQEYARHVQSLLGSEAAASMEGLVRLRNQTVEGEGFSSSGGSAPPTGGSK